MTLYSFQSQESTKYYKIIKITINRKKKYLSTQEIKKKNKTKQNKTKQNKKTKHKHISKYIVGTTVIKPKTL